MCSKRMVFSVLLVCCVLASALAWPSTTFGTKKAATVEDAPVAEEASTQPTTGKVSEKAESLQSKVSELQGVLSSNSSNAKKLEELEGLLNDAETGLSQMTDAYEKAMKEVDGVHVAALGTVGYTTGNKISQAWDAGLEVLAKYKKAMFGVGVSKQLDFKDFGGALKSGDGYRISVSGGYQLF